MRYGEVDKPIRTRQVIQIEVAAEHIEPRHLGLGYEGRSVSPSRATLLALCNDGSMWSLVWHDRQARWERLRDIPQD